MANVIGSLDAPTIKSFVRRTVDDVSLVATDEHVSAEHLPLYVNEFTWRHNHRADEHIFHALLAGCGGASHAIQGTKTPRP